jgi:hypothetical protein
VANHTSTQLHHLHASQSQPALRPRNNVLIANLPKILQLGVCGVLDLPAQTTQYNEHTNRYATAV